MLKNYFKVALKVLLRRKFFTFISLFAISFTLVVLMLVASVLNLMFAPMPPETKLDRTLGVFQALMFGKQRVFVGNPGYAFLSRYVKTLPDVEMVSIFSEESSVSSFKDGYEIKSQLKRTDGEFWKILDFQFLEGGPITDEDERNANFVAVIDRATREKFFGNETALGKFIEADLQRFRIVGVVADIPDYRHVPFANIWVPVSTTTGSDYRENFVGGFKGLILAHSRSDFGRIQQEFNARLRKVQLPSSDFDTYESAAETEFDAASREFFGPRYSNDPNLGDRTIASYASKAAGLLVLGTFLFMLLPAVNLININISRMIERASEIGVRKSFGASSLTLVGQFLVENLLLTLIGGVVGLVVTILLLHIFTASGIIPYAEFQFSPRVFLFAIGAILVFSIMSGVYPAWKMGRMEPVDALKGVVR